MLIWFFMPNIKSSLAEVWVLNILIYWEHAFDRFWQILSNIVLTFSNVDTFFPSKFQFLWCFVVNFFVPQYFNLRSELAATRKWGGDHLRRAAAFKSSGRSSFLTPTWLEASQVFGKSGFEFEAGQVTCSRLPPADNGACPALQQEALCLPAPPYF